MINIVKTANASNFIEIEHANCIVVSSVNVAKQIHVFLSCIFYLKFTLDTFYIEEYADFVRSSIKINYISINNKDLTIISE